MGYNVAGKVNNLAENFLVQVNILYLECNSKGSFIKTRLFNNKLTK